MKLAIVVPCYNEEANVKRFFNEVNNVFLCNVDDYEFVFVNDGSKDKTFDNLKELYEENSAYNIQVLSFSRNFGKESAMYAGLKSAGGNYVAVMTTDDAEFGGFDRVDKTYKYKTEKNSDGVCGFYCYLPSRTATVFRKV